MLELAKDRLHVDVKNYEEMLLAGYHDVTVGYLETRDAMYQPDSMIIKAELDPG